MGNLIKAWSPRAFKLRKAHRCWWQERVSQVIVLYRMRWRCCVHHARIWRRSEGEFLPSRSRFSHVWLLATLWTVAGQTPLSMGFSREEHRSGFHVFLQGIFPYPGIKLPSPALVSMFFITCATWKVQYLSHEYNIVSVAQSFIKILIENHFLNVYYVYGT